MTAQKYDKNWTYAGNFGQSRRNREALRNSLRDTAACKLLTNHTTSVNLWKNADYQYRLWWIFRKKHTVQRDFLLTGCVDADKILTVSPPQKMQRNHEPRSWITWKETVDDLKSQKLNLTVANTAQTSNCGGCRPSNFSTLNRLKICSNVAHKKLRVISQIKRQDHELTYRCVSVCVLRHHHHHIFFLFAVLRTLYVLEIWVRGHSSSLEIIPFDRSHTSSY